MDLNKNEVRDVRFVTQEELKQLIETVNNKEVFITPWFGLIAKNFLHNWWSGIDHLQNFIDNESIHRVE